MAVGLLITTGVSFYTFSRLGVGLDLATASSRELAIRLAPLQGPMIISLFAELGLVIGLSWLMKRLSPGVAAALFLVYAALNGFTLTLVLIEYTLSSVAGAFLTTTAMFAVMSVIGFTTTIDLTKYRSLFLIGLIGLVIAMIVNVFLGSGVLELVISLVGVVLFLGLTAWDTQRIKNMAADPAIQENPDMAAKMSIFGALMLYLDFVNLFLFLIRLMGRRR
jgi:FtsH-binding integral membrane protein